MTDIPRGQGGDGSPQPDLDTIEAKHHSDDGYGLPEPRRCVQCWWVWPCPTSQLVALVRRLQQESKELRADVQARNTALDAYANKFTATYALEARLRGRVEELTEALRSIRRVLNDDGDGAGPGAMFSMIDRHLEAAGFLT